VFDLLISDARIVDGTGAPTYAGDIGLRGGRIAAIGTLREPARRTIRAEGRAVSPGFIDVHTHYDAQLFWDPILSPSTLHGVTTMVVGNCGFSIAPLAADTMPYLRRMLARVEGMPVESLEEGVPWDWESFGGYLARLEGKIGPNVAFLCGHSALRLAAMGERAIGGTTSADDLDRMKALLAASLREGAIGFSSTLAPSHNDMEGRPVPSRYAPREEFVEFAKLCGEVPGTMLGFIPGLDPWTDFELGLMTEMSLVAQRPLNWNPVLLRPDNGDFIAHQLTASDHAAAAGAEVFGLAMVMPPVTRINFRGGFLLDVFDGWAELFEMSYPDRIAALADKARRPALAQGAERNAGTNAFITNWGGNVVSDSRNKALIGRRIEEIARERGAGAFDTFLDIVVADELATIFEAPQVPDDDAIWRRRAALCQDPRIIVGASDAGAHLDTIDAFTYPTVLLAAVRERGLFSLEEAVRLMTLRPARLMGLRDRGLIREGWRADLVLFDPYRVAPARTEVRHDLPGGQMRLYAEATGIDHVLVGGVPLIEANEHAGALPGSIVRPGIDTARE
jgi:N-acyl-D-aspartate/D-glutamate deacylase